MQNTDIIDSGVMVVGCGKSPEEKVVGSTELNRVVHERVVFLANGLMELYINGKKEGEDKWTIIGK